MISKRVYVGGKSKAKQLNLFLPSECCGVTLLRLRWAPREGTRSILSSVSSEGLSFSAVPANDIAQEQVAMLIQLSFSLKHR